MEMKKVLLAIGVVLVTGFVQADGESDYASLGCVGCHGAAGHSAIDTYPNLAGQKAGYLIKQLKDFQNGARRDATMTAMSALAAGKEEGIAEYLSKQ
jgi:cytochrome c553